MKKINTLLIVIVLGVFTSSCYHDGIIGIHGSGPIVSEEVVLADFTGIDLSISGEVIITKGNHQSVYIEAQQNILDNIIHRVRRDQWIIEFDRNVREHDGIKIFVTVPEIEDLDISGSGNINSSDHFITDKLNLSISGSGNISFDVDANNVFSHISGSGNINVSGSSKNHDAHISGSGSINAYDLFSNNCDVNISGSGNTKLNVADNLEVSISGSGSVYYLGHPSISSNISGSGSISTAY